MPRWFPDAMPQPMASNESLPWWEAAAEHRLVVQRCSDCSHQRLPPALATCRKMLPICVTPAYCRCEHWLEASATLFQQAASLAGVLA